MATITTHVCDRCKKKIEYRGWTGKLKAKTKKVKLERIFNGNCDGYSWSEDSVELCTECTEFLMAWLRNEPKEKSHD